MRRSTIFSALPKVLLWSALSLCACTKDDAVKQEANRGVEVGFCAGGVSTRTHITSNGLSSSWDAGDKVSLWAVNSEGRYYLANRQFYLHAAGDGVAFFTAVLDEPMTEGQYTYYLTSPSPVSTEGTRVSFDLPSVQDGKAGKGADIMIGTPTEGCQLDVLPEIVDHSTLRMELNHILHHFRFYIPEDDTAFADERIEKLVVSFPRPVVGTLTADCTDPASELTLSSASQTVTLVLDEPISRSSASAKEYAVASVIPFAAQAGESVSIKAYCHNSVVEAEPVSLAERAFLAGHSTPVKIRPASVVPLYRLHFVLAGSNLGELPLKITLSAPSGCVFENGSNVYEYEQGDEIQIGQEMEFVYEDEAQYRTFSGKNIVVTYESRNAIVTQTITMPSMTQGLSASVGLTVPYLLFQDFNSVGSYSSNDAYTGGFNSASKGGVEFLPGWNGARFGAQAGTSVRLSSRRETSADYPSRIDTEPLSCIKAGHSVTVKIVYNYGGDRKEGGIGGSPKCNQYIYIGKTTKQGTIASGGSVYSSNVVDWVTGGKVDLSSIDGTFETYFTMDRTGDSYDSTPAEHTDYVSDMDKTTRVTFLSVPTHASGTTNGNYWTYLDNIRISIDN